MQAGGAKAGVQVRFQYEDIDRIVNSVPMIKHISPEAGKQANVAADNRSYQLFVDGVSTGMQGIRKLVPEAGRFFNDEDYMQRAARGCDRQRGEDETLLRTFCSR
jgi:putative ABC transport system permease protein